MAPGQVTHYLGTPTRDVAREETRLLDYYNTTCNFSVFLKRADPDEGWRVSHVFALDEEGELIPFYPCVRTFLKRPAPD